MIRTRGHNRSKGIKLLIQRQLLLFLARADLRVNILPPKIE